MALYGSYSDYGPIMEGQGRRVSAAKLMAWDIEMTQAGECTGGEGLDLAASLVTVCELMRVLWRALAL